MSNIEKPTVSNPKELKPCPFCGCPAMLVGGGKCSTGDIPRGVECSSKLCGANIPRRFVSREIVVEMWNRRSGS